jgi:hypothetical protein
MAMHVSSYCSIQDILDAMKGMLSYKLDSVYMIILHYTSVQYTGMHLQSN